MTTARRLVRFGVVSALGVGVQLAAIWLLIDVAGLHYLPATIAGVAAAVVHNFVWHRRWTWAERTAGAGVLMAFAGFALGNGLVSLAGNVVLMAVLVGALGVPAIAANAGAIAACGCLNFWIGDRVVFVGSRGLKTPGSMLSPGSMVSPGSPCVAGLPRAGART
jgi:putative flippase GtrA